MYNLKYFIVCLLLYIYIYINGVSLHKICRHASSIWSLQEIFVYFLNNMSLKTEVMMVLHNFLLLIICNLTWKFCEDSGVVSHQFLPDFEFKVILLDWLPAKAREASLPCYLSHKQCMRGDHIDSCLKGLCTKVMATD